jgi:hypothetical protein
MNRLLNLHPGTWTLHVLPVHYPKHLLISAAHFVRHSPLIILDCGRQYDASIVARAAQGRKEVVDRIDIQRAFICSEVARLIRQTPASKSPILILDLLSTFCDENVALHKRTFLFASTVFHIKRLSRGAGLAVSVQALSESQAAFPFFQRLCSIAPRLARYQTASSSETSRQLSYF